MRGLQGVLVSWWARTTPGIALLVGCSAVWSDSDPIPRSADTISWALELGGERAGHETWRTWRAAGEEHVVRERTWVLFLDGARHEVTARTEITLVDGRATALSTTDGTSSRTWTGLAWLPEVHPPPSSGMWPVLDPSDLQVVDTRVQIEPGVARWATPAGAQVEARHDTSGPTRVSQGSVVLVRVETLPAVEPLDVVAMLRVPTGPLPTGALVGRFTVDGEAVVTDAPLWAELARQPVAEATSRGPTELVELASTLVGGSRSRRDAVRVLASAVGDRLDGRPTPGAGDALIALRSGRGDCTEHAVLFDALAAAAGMRSRVRGGLVFLDGAAGPGLYPHAWNEVHFEDRWVAIDAALGQVPADATHVPLGDDLTSAMERLAAGVEVRVVEVR